MPDADAARLAAVIRRVGKDVADQRQQPRLLAQPALALVEAVAEILVHDRDAAGRSRRTRSAPASARWSCRDPAESRPRRAGRLAYSLSRRLDCAALAARPDADHVHRTVRRIVVGVAQEVLGGELPVGREHPFVHADHLGAARPAVAAIDAPGRGDRPRRRDRSGSPAPPGPTTPTPCPCTARASAPRSATTPRGSACPRTARDTAARPAACRRWCSSRNDTGRRTATCCPARSGTPSCRDGGRSSGTRAPRLRWSRHRITDSSPMRETKKSPGLGIRLSCPTNSQARVNSFSSSSR